MPYYSARDVSGLFTLNPEKKDIKKKPYIRLELEEEISFADEISFYDYLVQKANFYLKKKTKDSYKKFFNEYRTIPDIELFSLVKLDDSEPCLINFFFFYFYDINVGRNL